MLEENTNMVILQRVTRAEHQLAALPLSLQTHTTGTAPTHRGGGRKKNARSTLEWIYSA
jgi:hypothetical protein